MKRLIVNADDFGYTPGVNRAIVEAHRSGIVTSTSLMANAPAFEDAVDRALAEPSLDVGCHVNFVEGRPLSSPEQIPHLIRKDGRFFSARQLALRLISRRVPEEEFEREAAAQIEKLLLAGIHSSHVNTHKHTHVHPAVARALGRAARRFAIPWIRRPFENFLPRPARRLSADWLAVASLNYLASGFERQMDELRLRVPDFFTGIALTGRLDRAALAGTLAELPDGITELMCHPGYADQDLHESATRLRQQRDTEREAVADPSWREHLREKGIVLTSFGKLAFMQSQLEWACPAASLPA